TLQMFALLIVKQSTGKPSGACGTFLAGQFLALHEVEHGNQGGGQNWINSGISRLKHNGQQRMDYLIVFMRCVFNCQFTGCNFCPVCCQRLQHMQGTGYAVKQTCTAMDVIYRLFNTAQLLLEISYTGVGDTTELLAFQAELFPAGSKEKIGSTAFTLQLVYQITDGSHQCAEGQKMFKIFGLAPF